MPATLGPTPQLAGLIFATQRLAHHPHSNKQRFRDPENLTKRKTYGE